MIIIPLILRKYPDFFFDKNLTVWDKHVYNCLCSLSLKSFFDIKDILKILDKKVQEDVFYSTVKKLEDRKYLTTQMVKDDAGKDIYFAISCHSTIPQYNINQIKALKFLDKNSMFRNVAFYGLSKRKIIRRQDSFSTTFFPIIPTRGFEAFKTEPNSLLYFFGKKSLGYFEKPEESLEELHYCGINVKKFCKIIIESLGRVSLQLSPKAPIRTFKAFLKECAVSTRLAMAIFLESCVFFAKGSETPEQFYKIIERISKSQTRIITKKEIKDKFTVKYNSDIDPKYSALIDFWNSKDLKKHKDYNAKLIAQACKILKRMENGVFQDRKERYKMEDFYSAIETFEAMANDPNIQPTSQKQKDFLKKLSFKDFFYNDYTGKSKFFDIMDTGSQTATKPYSQEAFLSLCKMTQRITNTKLTGKNKNSLAVFINSVKLFFDHNRSQIQYEATILKICSAIIRSLTKNGKFLNYNFLISEQMRLNYILEICLAEGFIIGIRRQKETVQYNKSPRKSNASYKPESDIAKKRRELIRENKEG